ERGERVHAGNAYADRCTWYSPEQPDPTAPGDVAGEDYTLYCVECAPTARDRVQIDHHRPGDPGYGRPPAEFLPASSLGQVIAELARLGLLPWERVGLMSYEDPEGCERGSLLPWYPH